MAKNLVIVESPAKAKTIKKFLGKDFEVKSSYGHIRDLTTKNLGVDVKNNYEPEYVIDEEKKPIIEDLKRSVKKSDLVWLASDEDREGEAIAWHLTEVLNLSEENSKRIVFHEITKKAIQNAIKNPRWIDFNLVNAQQARRILDRLVGFELSELLWKKVKGAMSAGRVQSVAVRLIVEREREIQNFKPKTYFKISAFFEVEKNGEIFTLKAEVPVNIEDEDRVKEILEKFRTAKFTVSDVSKKQVKKKPQPPFTTSSLQQEASRKFGFSVAQTMRIAQKLYEEGKITYMRTDSTTLSDEAIEMCKNFIVKNFGQKYSKPRQYKTKVKNAQEAHEAIRPTSMKRKVSDNPQEQKLYELIFNRTLASQMAEAVYDKTVITVEPDNCSEKLTANAEILKFDGFLKAYNYKDIEETDEEENFLPEIKKGDVLNLLKAIAKQKFTNPPSRYNEASLVRKLEELGIGRPSTYAPIISTIQKRNYVVKQNIQGKKRKVKQYVLQNNNIQELEKEEYTFNEKNKLVPTDVGFLVTDFLVKYFEKIMDYNFTASVEKDFDEIAAGKIDWRKVIDNFYKEFHKTVEATVKNAKKQSGERYLGDDPETGKPVYAKVARYGPVVQLGESRGKEKPKFASLKPNQHIDTITLEEALALFKEDRFGRYLGDDPVTGKPVYARYGKYGPFVQIGGQDDPNPKYASLLKGQNIEKITLEEALKLFELPRNLGKYQDEDVIVAVGRFGPYIKYKNKFVSLKRKDNPLSITLERAIELINEKEDKDKKNLIKTFEEDDKLKIIKDRWGKPVIHYKRKFYKIPKDTEPASLTYDECLKIIKQQQNEKK